MLATERALASPQTMGEPSKPVVVQLRPSDLVLLWQPGSDTAGAEGYRVELRRSLHDGVNHETVGKSWGPWEVAVPNTWSLHPACHLRDLQPERCYEFRVAAVNGLSSRSGLCALLAVCRPRAILITGSHRNSLAALRSGAAEVASIDAVTWTILERCDPAALQGITRVDRTPSAPAPPFVMRRGGTHERIARALEAAMRGPATVHARRALGISGVVRVSLDDYLPVRDEYLALASRIPRILG